MLTVSHIRVCGLLSFLRSIASTEAELPYAVFGVLRHSSSTSIHRALVKVLLNRARVAMPMLEARMLEPPRMLDARMLVVFEGEGTLWWRLKSGKDIEPVGEDVRPEDVIKRGKTILQLRPGLREVLSKMLDSNIAIGFWTVEARQKEKAWMVDIFGKSLLDRLLFTWYADKTSLVGREARVKESAVVAAKFPQYGYSRTLFVDHDFMSHAMSLPGNLLLTGRFSGCLPDVFLESWVWEMVKVMLDWLEKPSVTSTIPHFLLSTNRPADQAQIEYACHSYWQQLKLGASCRPLVDREIESHAPGAIEARLLQQSELDTHWPTWRDVPYKNATLAKLKPVVPGDILYFQYSINFNSLFFSIQAMFDRSRIQKVTAICNICYQMHIW
jgi:hypothetical protein